MKLLRQADGSAVVVTVPLPEGRTLHAHVWRAQVGRVSLLLLDTDIEENAPAERGVTDRLYGGDEDHRLRQEMLLGIGGVRALRAYCGLTGDAGAGGLPRQRGPRGLPGRRADPRAQPRRTALSFPEALQAVRAGTVFTTHTPVPAGIDRFPKALIERYFAGFGVPLHELLALGAEEDPTKFNMAHMGLRLGQRANGVSQLHGHVSRGMFSDLWPGFDESDVPIGSITNGVHAPTWTARELVEMGTQTTSQGDPVEVDGAVHFDGVDKISAARPVEHPPHPARAAGRGGAPPDQRDGALPRRDRGRGRLDRDGVRPRRPHHRLRPPRALLQAADADAARPGAAQGAAAGPRAARCSWSSPARATRPTTAASS